MSNESWDDTTDATNSTAQQSSATTLKSGVTLGFGRGKPPPKTNDNEPQLPSTTKWNSNQNDTSTGFGSFRSRNNDENSNPSSGGGFGSRNGGNNNDFSGRNRYEESGSGDASKPRSCYNCQQTGHLSRDCPQPRNENQSNNRGGFSSSSSRGGFSSSSSRGGFSSGGSRGGFNSSTGGDRNVNLQSSYGDSSSMSVTVRNSRNQNDGDQYDDNGSKSSFNGGGFRGGRGGGFNSGNRDNRGGYSSDNTNCFNCNKPGHRSRECPEERKPRDNGSSGFFSGNGRDGGGDGNRRNDRDSDNIFDQPGGHTSAHPTERYIPPPPPTSENDIFGEATERGKNIAKYHQVHVQCTPEDRLKPIELYEEANFNTQILSNIRRANFAEPTAIQRYTIPCIQQQDDLMACAQTGSGKTAAFLLPIISNLLEFYANELAEKNHPPAPLCLILSPTRELALQTEREARKFAYQTSVIPCSAVGGHDTYAVSDRLREGCHILSATTGRLKDMVEKGRISLKKVKYFVLDEADRMLDTGFEPDIRRLEELGIPSKDERCTSMFSATFPAEVQRLAKAFLRDNYLFLVVGTMGGANEDIAQTIQEVPQANKKERLFQLLEENLKGERCLIFVETKRSADYIGTLLSQKNFMSTTMHGDRTQRQRYEAVQQFSNGKCPILVATSVAARGLDFPLIGYVINYDLPDSSDFYIHRIGRTGRAGHLGKSISFFDPERESDRRIAPDLVTKLTEAGQDVPEFLQKIVSGGSGTEFSRGAFGGRNNDMRSGKGGFGSRNQTGGFSGGTASSGGAREEEEWK
ncbi:hypothetical protein I4U23_028788 [Adineta vaga]|nr:hypothetical protein I4U23_028788 [Adineta vaga]